MTKAKPATHLTLGFNSLRCLNCGTQQELQMPMSIRVMHAMSVDFEEQHRRCTPSEAGAARMRYATPDEWIRSWDTGVSSIAIYKVMHGHHFGLPPSNDPPRDPADFGRCYRLLRAFPGWRARIGEMRTIAGWESLVDAWGALETMYEEELQFGKGSAPRLYAELERLRTQPAPPGSA